MVSVLSPSTVDRDFEPGRSGQTIQLVFVAPPLSTSIKEKEQRLVGLESG